MSNEKKLVVKLNEKPFKDGEIAPDQDAVLITDGTDRNKLKRVLLENLVTGGGGTTWEVVDFDPNDQDGQGNHYVPGNEDTIVFVDPVIGTLYDGNVYKYNPDDGAHGKPFWTLLFNVNSGGAGGAPLIFGWGDPRDNSVEGNAGDVFVDRRTGTFYRYENRDGGSAWDLQFNPAESLWRFHEFDANELTPPPQKEEELWFNTTNGKLFKYDFKGDEWVNVYTFNTEGGGGFNLDGASINGKCLGLEDAGAAGSGLAVGAGSITGSYGSFAHGMGAIAGKTVVIKSHNVPDLQSPPLQLEIELDGSFKEDFIDPNLDLVIVYSGKSANETRVLEAGQYSISKDAGPYFLIAPWEPRFSEDGGGGFEPNRWKAVVYNAPSVDLPEHVGGDLASGFSSQASGGGSQALGLGNESTHAGACVTGALGKSLWPFSHTVGGGGNVHTVILNTSCTVEGESEAPLMIELIPFGLGYPISLDRDGLYVFRGTIAGRSGTDNVIYDAVISVNVNEGIATLGQLTIEAIGTGTLTVDAPKISIVAGDNDRPCLLIPCSGIEGREIRYAGSFTVTFATDFEN